MSFSTGCYADAKTESDACCTSSNAAAVIESFDTDTVIFLPDEYLARNVARETGKRIFIPVRTAEGIEATTDDLKNTVIGWPGRCEVHEQFTVDDVRDIRKQFPEVAVLAHPECDQAVLDQADFIASTTGIIKRAVETKDIPSIIATEDGVFHSIWQQVPDKVLYQAPGMDESCACNQCPYMRLNTLDKLYLALRDLAPQVTVEESIRVRALVPIERMLSLS